MEILPYEPQMAPGLAALYNSHIRGLPHCYGARPEQLAAALAGEEPGELAGRLRDPAAVVALEDGVPVGFVHTAVEVQQEAEQLERGVVRFLLYDRGHRAAGQALLSAAEDLLRERGATCAVGFHQDYRLPFYHIGHAYLTDRLEHVHALMGINGYRRCAGEVYLDWPDHEPAPVVPAGRDVELRTQWLPGAGARDNLTVRAFVDGEPVGICENRCCGEYSDSPEAQDWLLTKWLGVNEEYQGGGLGRQLLQTALNQMHEAGYRHAVISTSWTNHRACLFYSNCGYRCVDWTYAVEKKEL
jgi:GNAT superfamily N-acetyltransferase